MPAPPTPRAAANTQPLNAGLFLWRGCVADLGKYVQKLLADPAAFRHEFKDKEDALAYMLNIENDEALALFPDELWDKLAVLAAPNNDLKQVCGDADS